MKKMSISKLLIIVCVSGWGLFHLISCKKSPDCDEPQYVLLAFDKNDTTLLPYTGRDTLYFQYKIGNQIIDTFTFVGAGKVKDIESLYSCCPEEDCNPEIEGETIKIRYNSIDTNLFLFFILKVLNNGNPKKFGAGLYLSFNADRGYYNYRFHLDSSFQGQYNEIILNGDKYYNAVKLFRGDFMSINSSDSKNTTIVNSEFGLLQVMIDSTQFWNRIEK